MKRLAGRRVVRAFTNLSPGQGWGISNASPFFWLEKLIAETGKEINTLNDFLNVGERVNHFHKIGCDCPNSFPSFPSKFPSEIEARNIFSKVLHEENATEEETEKFTGSIMLFLGRLSRPKLDHAGTPGTLAIIPAGCSPRLGRMRDRFDR